MDTRPSNAFEAISTGVQDALPEGWRRAAQRNPGWFWAGGLVVLAALVWYLFFSPSPPPAKPKEIPVTVAKVAISDVPVSITALGAAQAWTSVTILAQVSGKLLSVNFAEALRRSPGTACTTIRSVPNDARVDCRGGLPHSDKTDPFWSQLSLNITSRSKHPGGVQSLFADGHVQFIKTSISLPIWQALGSANGGEVVSSDSY